MLLLTGTFLIPKSGSKLILVIIAGHAGSEKSTLAGQIGLGLGFEIVDKDDVQDQFTWSRSSQYYRKIKPETYQIVYDQVERRLSAGQSVILVAPFDSGRWKTQTGSIKSSTLLALLKASLFGVKF